MSLTDRMRAYQREYARKRRKQQRLSRGGTGRCPVDGAVIEHGMDALGRIITTCPGCERRDLRQCQDCGQRVKGRSWRCERCKMAAKQEQYRVYARRIGKRALCEREKARYRRDPEFRKRRNEKNRRWRRANPFKVAMQKRRARLAGRGGFATREAYLAYHRAYNAARQMEKREYMKQRAKFWGTGPTCRQCTAEIPWNHRGRPRLDCDACRAATRIALRRAA